MIVKCPHKEYHKWKEWYLQQQPKAIDDASKKIFSMVEELKKAINQIDEKMIKKWVEDLVIDKTFIGLKFQEGILKRVAKLKKMSYRLANPHEESRGVDGFIDNIPISIKPITYKAKNILNERIEVRIIYYEKKKDGVAIDISELE